ncbi:Fungalysin/Thermolysin Extracellular metalloproteinase 5 [Ceratobasidium sp. 392]|nr:Fungalysin/Thermolysin Extracellular metalloproteinase 5 [Ceratobasidium sp. 392]
MDYWSRAAERVFDDVPVLARLFGICTDVSGHHSSAEDHLFGEKAVGLTILPLPHDYPSLSWDITALDPSKIIAVADWVKDAPAPNADGWLTALEEKVFGQSVFGPQEAVRIISSIISSFSDKEEAVAASPGGTYRVWKWGVNDPASGNRTLDVSPYDKTASPLGWHSVPARNDPVNLHPGMNADTIVNHTTTVGNNVIAQANWAGGRDWKSNPRPNGGPDLVFDFPYGANPWDQGWETREPRTYVNASVTQLFYLSNVYHDLLYLYGFDEVSGNFQQYNFGKGGGEGDGVILDAQDSSGFNNANFLTPPDGTNGRCRMYVWNTAKPFRDGGLDAGILIHELSHGLSTRLTGGPRAPSCLDANEAGGMGEG